MTASTLRHLPPGTLSDSPLYRSAGGSKTSPCVSRPEPGRPSLEVRTRHVLSHVLRLAAPRCIPPGPTPVRPCEPHARRHPRCPRTAPARSPHGDRAGCELPATTVKVIAQGLASIQSRPSPCNNNLTSAAAAGAAAALADVAGASRPHLRATGEAQRAVYCGAGDRLDEFRGGVRGLRGLWPRTSRVSARGSFVAPARPARSSAQSARRLCPSPRPRRARRSPSRAGARRSSAE